MRKALFKARRRGSWAGILLLALLVLRAYVPAGFMPASGTPFLLELCPAALAAEMPASHAHHHSGTHSNLDTCPFGSAPAGGPVPHLDLEIAGPGQAQPILALETPSIGLQPRHSHQPRGPPSLA
jgi:hypothetical protein